MIKMAHSSATFTLGNWTVLVHGNHVYDWVSGPKHRLDVSFSARGAAAAGAAAVTIAVGKGANGAVNGPE